MGVGYVGAGGEAAKTYDQVAFVDPVTGLPAGTAGNPLATTSALAASGTATDRSGAITAGGTAQTLAAANTSRRFLKGQNISSGDLWVNEMGGTAAADTAGSYKVTSGSSFAVNTTLAVSIVGATTGQKFSATEG